MKELSEYHNTLVRVTCRDGTVVTGPCEWLPPEYVLCEYGEDIEGLMIEDTLIYADFIAEIELLRPEVCIPVRDWIEATEEIAAWFHERWGVPLEAYRQSIRDCLRQEESTVPQWYVVVRGSRIVAGCGVIENDFHERTDLAPNVCAVYVDEPYRKQGIAGFMLQYVCEDMAQMGFPTLYLLTDHTGFYERYGWRFCCMARGSDGELSRMYVKTTEKTKGAERMETMAEPSREELEKLLEKAQKDYQEALEKLTPEERAQAELRAKKLVEEDQARLQALVDDAAKAAAAIPAKPKPKFCTNCGAPVSGGKFCTNCGSPL